MGIARSVLSRVVRSSDIRAAHHETSGTIVVLVFNDDILRVVDQEKARVENVQGVHGKHNHGTVKYIYQLEYRSVPKKPLIAVEDSTY